MASNQKQHDILETYENSNAVSARLEVNKA